MQPIVKGEFIKWDYYTRQGVRLFPKQKTVDQNSKIKWRNCFDYDKGEMVFNFEFE